MHAVIINFHYIKAAGRQSGHAQQVMLGSTNNAFLFYPAHAGRRATMVRTQALTHLDKHQRAVCSTHDQIDLAAAAPRCPIIARLQTQATVL